MLVIISSPDAVHNEAVLINQLFESGLPILHMRKPNFTEQEMISLLREIDPKFLNRIALHQHHHLADRFGISRLHFTAVKRKSWKFFQQEIEGLKHRYILSTSLHDLSELEEFNDEFAYVFVSPVFDSISKKGYKSKEFDLTGSPNITQPCKLIALGGITVENYHYAIEMGFNGVAMLGAIWQNDDPVEEFKKVAKQCLTSVQLL